MHDTRSASPLRRVTILPLLLAMTLVAFAATAGAAAADSWTPAWTALWQAPPERDSNFERTATLSDGDVVVTGSAPRTARGANKALVARYDQDGTLLWSASWTPSSDQWSVFRWVGRDECDNIYVVCPTYDSVTGMSQTALVKYSADGERVWARNPILPPEISLGATSFAVDRNGNSYIVGSGDTDFGGSPWIVVKVGPGGHVRWTATEERTGWNDGPSDVAVRGGSVYVAGSMAPLTPDGMAMQACTTIAYSAAGERLWAADYATPSTWQSFGEEIVARASGITVLGGHYTGEDGIPEGMFALRYSLAGEALWQTAWSSPNGGPVWAMGLAPTRDGGAAIGAMYPAPGIDYPGDDDTAVVLKIGADGLLAWATPLDLGTADQLWTLKERADGTIAGAGTSDFSNVAAAEIGADGALLWADRFGMTDRTFDPRTFSMRGRALYAAGASWNDVDPFETAAMVRLQLP